MPIAMMKGSVGSCEAGVREAEAPRRRQRRKLCPRRADAVEEDDQRVFGQLSLLKVGRHAEAARPTQSTVDHSDAGACRWVR